VSCPGAWSLTNKYNGIPPYVTCVPPSGREIVPSLLELTPLPAVAELTPAGRSTGGHVVAHEAVHMIVPSLSDANSYSVNPFESTSTVPAPGTDFVPMMTEPACALVEPPPPELGAEFLAQADNAISVAADAIQTRWPLLVDTFTFVLLRQGLSSPADALPRVCATRNTTGPQVRFIGSTPGIDPRSNPFAFPSVVPRHAVPAIEPQRGGGVQPR
jgi:hypothetical protein